MNNEYGTPTRNTTNTSNANVHYAIYGKLCVLTGWVQVTSTGANVSKVLLTDIPAPKMNTNVYLYD